jgi:hypothetical protein
MKSTSSLRFCLSAVLFSAVLSACTGLPIQEAIERLAVKPICCKNFSELPFQHLSAGVRLKFALSTASPVMQTGVSRSYVAAFSLPPGATTVQVQSMNSAYLPNTSYVDPLLVFLDSEKRPIEQRGQINLQKGKHVIVTGLWEWYFGADLRLPTNAAHLVVFADNASNRVQTATADNGALWPVPSAPIGSLALVVR